MKTSNNYSPKVSIETEKLEALIQKNLTPEEQNFMEQAKPVVAQFMGLLQKATGQNPEDLEEGDAFVKILTPDSFGRRLINTAKQHMVQKIRDIERQSVFDEFSSKIGEIVVGSVHQIQRDQI